MFSDEIDRIEAGLQDIIAALQGVRPPDAPKVPVSGRYSCQMRQLERKLQQVAQGIGALNLYSLTNAGAGFAHSDLAGRDTEEQHPVSAITGLAAALEGKVAHTVTGERYQLRIRTTGTDGLWVEVGDSVTGTVARTGVRIAADGTLQSELAWEGTQGVSCGRTASTSQRAPGPPGQPDSHGGSAGLYGPTGGGTAYRCLGVAGQPEGKRAALKWAP